MSKALETYLETSGNTQKWLAEQLGVRPPSVNGWLKHGVPAARVPAVARLTGLSMSELRPDVFSDPV